jgi:hypothetical protein
LLLGEAVEVVPRPPPFLPLLVVAHGRHHCCRRRGCDAR